MEKYVWEIDINSWVPVQVFCWSWGWRLTFVRFLGREDYCLALPESSEEFIVKSVEYPSCYRTSFSRPRLKKKKLVHSPIHLPFVFPQN